MKVQSKSCGNSPMASSNSPGSASHRNGSLSFPFQFFSVEGFSYGKIPDQPLKFTVLKLDGTSFDIEVAGNRTVVDLKNAVEAAFSHLEEEDGAQEVSWSHVWGHFCLSYNGKQLLTDSDYIESHGIKDGDKLAFTRQETISQPVDNQSEGEDSDVSDDTGDRQASCKEGGDYKCDEDDRGERDKNEEESEGRSRLVYFLRKWFSYSRFRAKEQGWNEMQQQEYALVSQEIL
nr:u11u12 small nuclear ribonucleoprotein 25 kDa protein [Ipomoea batatas]